MNTRTGLICLVVCCFFAGLGCGDEIADEVLGSDKAQQACEDFLSSCEGAKEKLKQQYGIVEPNCDLASRAASQKGCADEFKKALKCSSAVCSGENRNCEDLKQKQRNCMEDPG